MRHIQHAHSHMHRFKAAINKNYDYYDGIECNEREKKMVEKFANEYITGYLIYFSSSSSSLLSIKLVCVKKRKENKQK